MGSPLCGDSNLHLFDTKKLVYKWRTGSGNDADKQGEALKERIERRAAELRREWIEQAEKPSILSMPTRQGWQSYNSSKNGAEASHT